MAKSTSTPFVYRLSIFYRVVLTFALGYLCMMYLSISLTMVLTAVLDKAEAVYLAAFIATLFYLAFIIISFCANSLLKLTMISLILTAVLFGLSVGLN